MFSELNNLLEWKQDFISNNLETIPKEPIYKTLNDNVFIFTKFTIPKIPKGYKQNIYQFIIDEFILENDVDGGFCYFCEFVFPEHTGGILKSFHESSNEKYSLCSNCVNLWKTSISMIFNTNTNDLFVIDDTRTNRITVNIIDNRNINYIILYNKVIIPIIRFSYEIVSNFIVDDDSCNLCYSELDYEANDMYFEFEEQICCKCLNYSKQIIIANNYHKYMIMVYSHILDDSVFVIINDFISLIVRINNF